MRFEKGVLVEFDAKEGKELLAEIFEIPGTNRFENLV